MSTDPFVEFNAGDIVLHEGEPAVALFIIESGHATIFHGARASVPLAMLGPGEAFGEAAVLQDRVHPASVRAETSMRALRIDATSLAGVFRENVDVGVQLMRQFVQRLLVVEQAAVDAPAAVIEPADAAPEPAAPVALLLRHPGGEIAVPAGKSNLLIGRPDPATGAIPEIDLGAVDQARTLSRRHARLLLSGGRWILCEEPGVGNGTWLNGERLQPEQKVPVKAGDHMRFGAIDVELLRD